MSIFHKLFLLLAGLVIVPLLAVVVVLITSAAALKDDLTKQAAVTGDLVAGKSGAALLRQVETTHVRIIQEKAGRLEGFFDDIRAATLLEAALIRQFLTGDPPATPPYPIYTEEEVNRRRDNDADWRREVFEKQPYAMFAVVKGVDEAVARGVIQRLGQLGGFFAHAFREVPGCASAYLGHRDGIIFGYPGGSRFSPDYDPRQRPWYTLARDRKTVAWTRVYIDRGDNDLIVTCAAPVYDADGGLLAVAAMDVRLIALLRELFALGDLPVAEAMLIDDEGRVRVSAKYENGQPVLDRQTILEPPLVADYRDAALPQVVASIGTAADSGIIAGPQTGEDESLYIHAPLRFRGGAAGEASEAGGAVAWRYILKVPTAPVTRPAREIRADVGGATDQMRTVMQDEVVRMAALVGGITAAAMVVAIGLALLFARGATRPLIAMQDAARRIAVGDLDQHVDVRSKDEIGRLGDAINQMIVGLRERVFLESTFKHYLAPPVVEELLRDPSKLHLAGEKRELTIFFSDIRDFTKVSESLPAETLVQLLNEYLSAMTDAIVAEEGTLDKYVGDAIVAFWGAPIAREDDALRACRTALDHVRRLHALWPAWKQRGLPVFDVRIGIHSGGAVVGNVGSKQRKNYTVIGDVANTSSRLEGVNKHYGTRILIGEHTRRQAGDAIITREIDLVALMGKQDVVRVYELVGLTGEVDADRLKASATFESALAAYRVRRWDEAAAGFTAVIGMLGDDGPSRVFIERIARYRTDHPREGWDGSFVMQEK